MRTETPSGLRTITHAHIEAIEAAQAFDQAQRITKWEAGELAKVACIAARVGDFPWNLLRDLIDRTQPRIGPPMTASRSPGNPTSPWR